MIQHFRNERQLSRAVFHNRLWTECWKMRIWGLGSLLLCNKSLTTIKFKDSSFVTLSFNINRETVISSAIFVFSDEATFYLNGSINLQNTFICAEENPHAVIVKPLKSASITCWAMVSPHHGIVHNVQNETMNGQSYQSILEEKVVPLLIGRRNRRQFYQ